MLKVYVPNRSGHDYSPASEFGELIYLTSGSLNRLNPTAIFQQFSELMADCSADDFWLVSSTSIANIIGTAILARRHGKLNLLLYRPAQNSYALRCVDIDAI